MIRRTIADYLDPDDVAEWESVNAQGEHDWGNVRSSVDTCLQAPHHHIGDTQLPQVTYGWDANSEGIIDGWAFMVTFYPADPGETISLGLWGEDGDVADDLQAEGEACAASILACFLDHYERLLQQAIALGIWAAPEDVRTGEPA